MGSDLPQQANYWGVTEKGHQILRLITYYFNGHCLPIRGEERCLATHHELPLKDLFGAVKADYKTHESAHQQLLEDGILTEGYICRRKIDWIPTEKGLQAIRDCLPDPWAEKFRPEWAKERTYYAPSWDESNTGGPLYGDPNEGLLHRKGVEVLLLKVQGLAWTGDHRGVNYNITVYPENDRGESCHDIHVRTSEHMTNLGIEVITENNNGEYLADKWKRYAAEDRNTLWIFDSRSSATRFFNNLDRRGLFYLDGGQFQDSGNWSAKAINNKIWRSANQYQQNEPGDLIHTITGVLEGDVDKIQNLFEDYYSKI